MNILGLMPGMFSSTSKLNTTLALAICVFGFVQFEGIRAQGLWGYIFHFMGSPKSTVEWCLVPLNLPLHIIGELAKPISLALRLFGNISGEDMLLAIFVGLGILITSALHPPAWLPGERYVKPRAKVRPSKTFHANQGELPCFQKSE